MANAGYDCDEVAHGTVLVHCNKCIAARLCSTAMQLVEISKWGISVKCRNIYLYSVTWNKGEPRGPHTRRRWSCGRFSCRRRHRPFIFGPEWIFLLSRSTSTRESQSFLLLVYDGDAIALPLNHRRIRIMQHVWTCPSDSRIIIYRAQCAVRSVFN